MSPSACHTNYQPSIIIDRKHNEKCNVPNHLQSALKSALMSLKQGNQFTLLQIGIKITPPIEQLMCVQTTQLCLLVQGRILKRNQSRESVFGPFNNTVIDLFYSLRDKYARCCYFSYFGKGYIILFYAFLFFSLFLSIRKNVFLSHVLVSMFVQFIQFSSLGLV